MKFISTRAITTPAPHQQSDSVGVSLSEAICAGLAADGGLYVPEVFPQWDGQLNSDGTINAATILKPFFKGDALEPELDEICKNAFHFEIPLKPVQGGAVTVLELFHGPTAAFKDVGARFLAECMVRLQATQPMTVMVATSGDTGGAVAAAFHGKPNTSVIILFPKKMVSARQKQQLTCWGDNITAYEVRGTFDDCQRMVKQAFQDSRFTSHGLTSANSINVGRLLPQMTYYAKSAVEHHQKTGRNPGFIIPSGNLGNAVAAFWAKKCGYPIGRIVMSTNANRAIAEYLETGVRTPHTTIATLANAMDVGNPSNLERAIQLYPAIEEFRNDAMAISVSDDEICEVIASWASQGEIWCPHTATAVRAWEIMMSDETSDAHTISSEDWIIVATAHPAKFETIVEPLIGHTVEVPDSLGQILQKKSVYHEIDADLKQVRTAGATK
jgi:threonine synthase